MARTITEDPIKVFKFQVSVSGFTYAGFSECSAIEAEVEAVEYREGGMNDTVRKSPGLTKFTDVTLKRGQLAGTVSGVAAATPVGNDFLEWFKQVFDIANKAGHVVNTFRKDITINQYDQQNQLAASWILHECWPKKVKLIGDLNATGNENVVQELVLSYEWFSKIF